MSCIVLALAGIISLSHTQQQQCRFKNVTRVSNDIVVSGKLVRKCKFQVKCPFKYKALLKQGSMQEQASIVLSAVQTNKGQNKKQKKTTASTNLKHALTGLVCTEVESELLSPLSGVLQPREQIQDNLCHNPFSCPLPSLCPESPPS